MIEADEPLRYPTQRTPQNQDTLIRVTRQDGPLAVMDSDPRLERLTQEQAGQYRRGHVPPPSARGSSSAQARTRSSHASMSRVSSETSHRVASDAVTGIHRLRPVSTYWPPESCAMVTRSLSNVHSSGTSSAA